ncbi:hypothetical protein [Dokdonella sp.]|uniref:hypothetical protein n=1 Tax=Dokdonella sp. TaxID=2291710 RepID=UPI002D7E5C5C|nr:hypothetical protein [Dokdonella sp.]
MPTAMPSPPDVAPATGPATAAARVPSSGPAATSASATATATANAAAPARSGPAPSDLAGLAARSNGGDAEASFELAGKIDRCRNIDRLLADAERVMQLKQGTHVTVSSGESGAETPTLDDMARRMLDRVDAVRSECETLGSADATLTAAQMLQRAIDQGSLQAKLCYLVDPQQYAPTPLGEAWHDWYARYREQAPVLVEDLVEAGVADGVLAAGLAYSGARDLNGGPSYLPYALGEDLQKAAVYLLWQQRFAPGARAQAFGRIIADLQARLGPAFAAAEAEAAASPPLAWLVFDANPAENCTVKLYVRAMEVQALGAF